MNRVELFPEPAPKNVAKKTKVNQAIGAQSKVKQDDARVWNFDAIKATISNIKAPSWVKTVTGFVANLLTIGTSYYVGMTITIGLATMVAGLSGSLFLTWMTLFLGQILVIIASIILGCKAQQFIVEDGYKHVLKASSAVSNKVIGWFKSAKAEAKARAAA